MIFLKTNMKNIYICKCSDVYDALITSQEKISCEDSGFELAGHV